MQQAEVIQIHENANVCIIGQGEPRQRLKLGGGQAMTVQVTRLLL
jgi:hypothetical protein